MSDYDRKDEKHWLPGNGVINWKELFAALEKAQYQGELLVEIRERTAIPGRITTPQMVAERVQHILNDH